MYQLEDTIAAIATPSGVGGIGIVRVSGDAAIPMAGQVFILKNAKPILRRRQVLFGTIKDPRTGEILDEGILLVMPKPHSYTTEDVVEFHVHGSPPVLEKLMEALVALGARPAEPGEFTYRAFLNGRLDLTQAEAVEALVSSQGEAARRQALRQLTGGLAAHLEPLEESLKSLYLKIEARLEFSEDGIPALDVGKFEKEVVAVQAELWKLIESYQQGKVIREGLSVALVGPPNVGKSSLLNALLRTQRAIVTPLAGTTRDVVEGDILLKGVKVRLFDTAGLQRASNVVEEEGIRRSRQVIKEVDILFWIMDCSEMKTSLNEWRKNKLPRDRTWILFNKKDLTKVERPWVETELPPERCLSLSCLTKEGLEDVVKILENLVQSPLSAQEVVLTSIRHQEEAQKAFKALESLKGLMARKEPYELWAEELREATLALGRIRGRNLPASAFEEIFTKFCIGK